MARAIKQGQHIFIAFQNGEAVLDSQLRPRMYKSVEQFKKSFPGWRQGEAELVEYAPTLTPPNEWVRVEERLSERNKRVLVHYSGGQVDIDCLDDFDQYRWESLYGLVTHWMPLPEPPARPPRPKDRRTPEQF